MVYSSQCNCMTLEYLGGCYCPMNTVGFFFCFFDNNLNGTKKKFMEELAVDFTDFVYLLIYLICVFAEGPHRSGPKPETSQNSRLPRWKTRLSMTWRWKLGFHIYTLTRVIVSTLLSSLMSGQPFLISSTFFHVIHISFQNF